MSEMWVSVVRQWTKQLEGKIKCAVCNSSLHRGNFPKDFPDEWKFCCNCYDYAKAIARYDLKTIIRWFIKSDIGIDKHTFIKRAKKIDKLVNVV